MTSRQNDPLQLHPEFRSRQSALLLELGAMGIPFGLFEGFRHPDRQASLYAQGRSTPGSIVTKALPWQSFHQYGFAGDYVLRLNGSWSWDDSTEIRKHWWDTLATVGKKHGLVALSFERPHLQLAGVTLAQLQSGQFPAGGDETWLYTLAQAQQDWGTKLPHAPRM